MPSYTASPTLSKFHRDDSFVRGVMGPIGSGKSTGCCWEIWRRACEQEPNENGNRRTRWAVIRNTYRELADTTVKTWLDWFPQELGKFRPADMTHEIDAPLPDGTRVQCEVLFRALDRPQDVKKLLSLELSGAWVNEAREIPRSVVDMLQGRVGRFPSQRDGGPTWMGVMLDTNPPDQDHWWYRLFEESSPDGWSLYRQPSGRAKNAENIENLPRGYYDRLLAGKDDEWVRVYVDGEYGFVSDGKPIYPEFRDSTHVSETLLIPGVDIVVGIDFGLTPAATFGQRDVLGRWQIHRELVTEDMGAVRFAQELRHIMQSEYSGHSFRVWGDPAGEQRSQVDERTPFSILQAAGIDAQPAPTNDFTIRRESVAGPLTRLVDGQPGLVINPACRVLRKGMGGGYSYRRIQVAGDERYHDKPDKNRFSHPCESLQYLLAGEGEGDTVTYTNTWDKPIEYSNRGIV